jgi:digeranylgeranylglycerophospholipid reductase
MAEYFDVLVVGGGPAGLAAGRIIAQAGFSVLIVHRDAEIGRPVRTSGGSWKSDIDRLGFPADVYQPIDRVTFAGPTVSAEVRFTEDRCVVLNVTRAYQHLGRLAAEAGATIRCSTSFLKLLRQSEDSIASLIEGPTGRTEILSRYVIEASGGTRAVLTDLGVAKRPKRIGVGVEIDFANAGSDPHHGVLFVGSSFSPSGYGWVFPAPEHTIRIGIGVIRPDSDAAVAPLLDKFLASQPALDRFGLKLGAIREKHFGVIPADGPAKRFLFGRVIAVGDSVSQALPTIGEGIRYCVDAGHEAGRAVVDALHQPPVAHRHLQRYADGWDRRYRRRFEMGQRVQERLGTFTDADWDEKIAVLQHVDERGARGIIRMDFTAADVLRFFVQNPLVATRFAAGRLKKRLMQA